MLTREFAAGIEMRKALTAFNKGGSNTGQPMLENGIGIASGEVIAGNVGGQERIEYTVMGDAANLAARLEDMTKESGYPILISEETYQALGSDPKAGIFPLRDVQIKGKQDRLTIYGMHA